MSNERYSLSDLSDLTGIESRTIRSYIERGLLPGAEARGRAASYSAEHLSRLRVIQALRRARPGITLNEVRIVLQQMNPEQIRGLASGTIVATAVEVDQSLHSDEREQADEAEQIDDGDEFSTRTNWEFCAKKLTGVERLVRLLHEISGFSSTTSASRVEKWQRITITPDIELSVRAEFDADQLAAFRNLADLLRHLLQHPDFLTKKDEE